MANPCIRCTQCETVCPVDLQPQFLHASIEAKAWDKVQALNLDACLFCSACTMACPSEIPLRDQLIDASQQIKNLTLMRQDSLRSKQRFESRQARLARKNQLHAAQKLVKTDPQAAIAAALARAQWKYEDG